MLKVIKVTEKIIIKNKKGAEYSRIHHQGVRDTLHHTS